MSFLLRLRDCYEMYENTCLWKIPKLTFEDSFSVHFHKLRGFVNNLSAELVSSNNSYICVQISKVWLGLNRISNGSSRMVVHFVTSIIDNCLRF